jgi:hypothetical protein
MRLVTPRRHLAVDRGSRLAGERGAEDLRQLIEREGEGGRETVRGRESDAIITPETMRHVYGIEVDIVPVGDGRLKMCLPKDWRSRHAISQIRDFA